MLELKDPAPNRSGSGRESQCRPPVVRALQILTERGVVLVIERAGLVRTARRELRVEA